MPGASTVGFSLCGFAEGAPVRFDLRTGDQVIGSSCDADLRTPCLGVSNRHARLSVRGADVTVEDLASKNGTHVNGHRVLSRHIEVGDVLTFGTLRLELVAEASPGRRLAIRLDPDSHRRAARAATTSTLLAGREPIAGLCFPPGFVAGESVAMRTVYRELGVAAKSRAPVLILGETGTGKELLARTLHDSSRRRGRPFVAVNCAAIPAELLEAELFGIGHRVATGVDRREGIFARADRGTLLLDEVGDMPVALQAKLLRVLETGTVERVGGERRSVDVRVVAATHATLEARLAFDGFRPDLYYRLAGFVLRVPPLRHRPEDIASLVRHFVDRHAREARKIIVGVTRKALDALCARPWPGNVRELEHALRRLVARCAEHQPIDSALLADTLDAAPLAAPRADVPPTEGGADGAGPLAGFRSLDLAWLEQQAVAEALRRSGGNQSRAAGLLGISRFALRRRLTSRPSC